MSSKGKEIRIQEAIVASAARGDRLAQTELYAQYSRGMYNVAYRMLEHREQAEDIMQEAFIDAFQALGGFEGNSTFGHWLKRIVINKCLDHLRRQKLIKEKNEGLKMEAISINENEKDENAWSEFSMEQIKAGIKKLAKNHKVVFQLYMVEGYDHEEIAEIMKISSSTSRSQLSRAKHNLKEILIGQKQSIDHV